MATVVGQLEFQQWIQDIRNGDCTEVAYTNEPYLDNDACAQELGNALLFTSHRRRQLNANDQDNSSSGTTTSGTIERVSIQLHQLSEDGDYNSLLEWIGHWACLEELTLDGNGDYTLPGASPVVVARFLGAIQTSSHIDKVELVGCAHVDATVFATFIEATTTITDLEMDCAVFVSEDAEDDGIEQVAVAFRNNHSLQRLYLDITDQTQAFVVAIVEQLGFNNTLAHLALEWSPSEQGSVSLDTTLALQALLLNRISRLQYLELIYFEFFNSDATLEPLVDGLQHCTSIEKLLLQHCRWDDSATHMLERALVSGTHPIRSLTLSHNYFGSDDCNDVTLQLLTTLLRSVSFPLTSLQLDSLRLREQDITTFIDAITNCRTLRHFTLGYSRYRLQNRCLYTSLIQALPHMRYLQHLCWNMEADDTFWTEPQSQALWNALRRNSSMIETTEIQPPARLRLPPAVASSSSLWLSLWARRNRGVQEWFGNHTESSNTERIEMVCIPLMFRQVASLEHCHTWRFRKLLQLGDAFRGLPSSR